MTPCAYYNEHDAQKAAWLRELIKANVIAPGEVDERSITEIRPKELRGFRQCVISSPALESGVMPFGSPDGPMTDLFGREVAPVRVSAPQEKAKGLQTLATSGHIGHPSSGSASLQLSLENRLHQRLDTAGSTLFTLTWKRRRTPLGRPYLERAVSVLRTSGRGSTSVPTPQVHDDKLRGNTEADNHHFPHDLSNTAMLAAVPTPMAGSPATETYNAAGNNDYSRKIVELASVATPMEYDSAGGGSITAATRKAAGLKRPSGAAYGKQLRHEVMLSTLATSKSEDSQCAGSHRGLPDTLHSQAQLAAGLATPAARDYRHANSMAYSERGGGKKGEQLQNQVRHLVSGATATGGTAATASIGQLNPDYSRWLMGLPTVFSSCADTAMQSVRRSRHSSSKRQERP